LRHRVAAAEPPASGGAEKTNLVVTYKGYMAPPKTAQLIGEIKAAE